MDTVPCGYGFKFVKSVPGVDGITLVDELKGTLSNLGREGYQLVDSFTEMGPSGLHRIFIMQRALGFV